MRSPLVDVVLVVLILFLSCCVIAIALARISKLSVQRLDAYEAKQREALKRPHNANADQSDS